MSRSITNDLQQATVPPVFVAPGLRPLGLAILVSAALYVDREMTVIGRWTIPVTDTRDLRETTKADLAAAGLRASVRECLDSAWVFLEGGIEDANTSAAA
jgi:hypothetical protein